MCCLWHPTIPGLILTGGEDCSLYLWRPEKQTHTKPVERKKKRTKNQDVAVPEVTEFAL